MTTEGKYAIFEQRNYRFFFAENGIEGSGKLNLEITKPEWHSGGWSKDGVHENNIY